jgi:cell division protein FtsW
MKKNPLPSYKHSPKPNGEAKLAAIYVACLTGLLSLIGLVLVSSASLGEGYNEFGNAFYFARQQATWWVVGWLGFAFGRYVPLRWWRKGALSAFLLSIVLMIAVFVPGVGKMVNGAHRWVDLGFLSFQPVEALKLSLVLYFADWMSRHRRMQTFLFLVALMAGLLLLQPDLGSALIVIGVATTMYFSAGARWRDIGAFLLGGIACVLLLIVVSPYRFQRLQTLINPSLDPYGSGFHIRQVLLALARGGWLGQGFGMSRQKYAYVPEASTDSIMAIVGEELGFVGVTTVLVLFFLLVFFGMRIVVRQPPASFHGLLAVGITAWLCVQVFLNLASVVALVPLTGVPLPLVSYGGTALVTLLAALGLLVQAGMTQANVSQ